MNQPPVGRLAGVVAVVTGVARPLGAAVARSLAGECRQWVAADADARAMRTARDEVVRTRALHRFEEEVPFLEADPYSAAGAQQILDEAVTRFGRVDTVVHCLAVSGDIDAQGDGAPLPNFGLLLPMIQAAVPVLRQQKHSHLVLAVTLGPFSPTALGQAAQEQAIRLFGMLVHKTAKALHPYHIHVNGVVMPDPRPDGPSVTLGWAPLNVDAQKLTQRYHEAARVARFLAHGEARALNGQTLLATDTPLPLPSFALADAHPPHEADEQLARFEQLGQR